MRKPCRRRVAFESALCRLPVPAKWQAPRELCATFSMRPRNPRLRNRRSRPAGSCHRSKNISGYGGVSIPPAGRSVGGSRPVGNTLTSPVYTAARTVSLAAINIGGALPFSAIGLFIGVLVSGSAAPGFVNLIYLPMMWLSGLFIPLPKSLQSAAPVGTAYHLRQLSLGALGQPAAGSALMHTAVLAGLTLVLSAVAVRRLARVG